MWTLVRGTSPSPTDTPWTLVRIGVDSGEAQNDGKSTSRPIYPVDLGEEANSRNQISFPNSLLTKVHGDISG